MFKYFRQHVYNLSRSGTAICVDLRVFQTVYVYMHTFLLMR